MVEHLVESALLTHGLKSVTNEEIRRVWTDRTRNITWISKGEIVVGTMEQYLDFRIKTEELSRIEGRRFRRFDSFRYDGGVQEVWNSFCGDLRDGGNRGYKRGRTVSGSACAD